MFAGSPGTGQNSWPLWLCKPPQLSRCPLQKNRGVDGGAPLTTACWNGHKPYLWCRHELQCISYCVGASARWPLSALPPNPPRLSFSSLLSFSEPCSHLEDMWFECDVKGDHVFHWAKFGCRRLLRVRLVFLCIPPARNQPVSGLPGCCHSLVSGSEDASCWEAKWPPVNRLTPQRFEFKILLHTSVYTITTLVLIYKPIAYYACFFLVCHLLDYPLRRCRCSCSLDECLRKLKNRTEAL